MTPFETVLERLRLHGCDPVQNCNGWKASCPAHEDNVPSLVVSEGDDGKVLFCCHASCSFEEIVGALGMATSETFTRTMATPLKPSGKSKNGKRDSGFD